MIFDALYFDSILIFLMDLQTIQLELCEWDYSGNWRSRLFIGEGLVIGSWCGGSGVIGRRCGAVGSWGGMIGGRGVGHKRARSSRRSRGIGSRCRGIGGRCRSMCNKGGYGVVRSWGGGI